MFEFVDIAAVEELNSADLDLHFGQLLDYVLHAVMVDVELYLPG